MATAPAEDSDALPVVTAQRLIGLIRESSTKGTLVNAWASWCGPCRREIPMLDALAINFSAQGVQTILVSMDQPEDAASAKAFLEEQRISLTSYRAEGPLGEFKRGLNPRWPGMLPASFLFDAAGQLRYFWGGEAFEEEIVPIIEGFVAGKTIDGESNFPLAPGRVE